MKIGTGIRRITPPIGTAMGGFAFRSHGCEGVRDDLHVRCLWLEDPSSRRLLVIALDLCSLDQAVIGQWKQEIRRRWGLADHEILVNLSHTHSGPLTTRRLYATESSDASYNAMLSERLMEAVNEAAHLEDGCTLHSGQTAIHLGICRRYPDGEGVKWAPYPGGYVERTLTVLTVADRHAQPLCVLFSLAAHPSILTDYLISAEYPGMACQMIASALGGRTMAMFLQGAAGDVKANINADIDHGKWQQGTYDHVKRSGRLVADAVLQVIGAQMHEVAPAVASALTMANLPVGLPADPDEYKSFYARFPRFHSAAPVDQWADYWLSRFRESGCLPLQFACPVQAIRIGSDLNFLAFGGELTSGLALRLRALLPATVRPVFLGYSNGVFGYLPSEQMVREGGYESVHSIVYSRQLPAPFAPGLEHALAAAAVACLHHIDTSI